MHPPFNWKHILLIDDDTILNLIHKKILDIIGYKGTVLDFSNGFKAIEYLRNDTEIKLSPTLIILDLEMPLMKGWGFLDCFGKLDGIKREDFKIVVSSSSTNPEDIHKALEYEIVDEFIPKPLTIEIFKRLVERH